jgi:predicted DNA-binding transcriptional regulator YafY
VHCFCIGFYYLCTIKQYIFEVELRPTFDFQQELLSMGSDVEVLSPKWFREDTAERVRQMWDKYKDDK